MTPEIGICSYFNFDLDSGQTFKLLDQANFKILTVRSSPISYMSPMPKWYKDQIRSAQKDLGFVLDSLHAPF